jgi:hypothetical protein
MVYCPFRLSVIVFVFSCFDDYFLQANFNDTKDLGVSLVSHGLGLCMLIIVSFEEPFSRSPLVNVASETLRPGMTEFLLIELSRL